MASVEVNQMLAAAAEACEDKKAEDIRILALDPSESGLTDYFLICTGTNDRQTVAITDEVELRLKREFNTYPNSVEGRRQGEWILMDYVDFLVHVFLPEKRAYYGLERLRPSATHLEISELNAEIKAAIAAKRPVAKKSMSEKAVSPAPKKRSAAKSTVSRTASAAAKSTRPAAKVPSKAARKASAKTVSRPSKRTGRKQDG